MSETKKSTENTAESVPESSTPATATANADAPVPRKLKAIEATKETQEMLDRVKQLIEAQLKCGLFQLTAIKYATESPKTVRGKIHFIKAQVGVKNYIHIRIYQPLSANLEVQCVQINKKRKDPIEYFDV